MQKRARWLAAALVLCSSTALAADAKATLYVKARNTRVMVSASPTADVVAVLQPGQQVQWMGADAQNKQWHHVRLENNKEGLVFQSNLSTKPPDLGIVAQEGQRTANLKSMASSGAAVKGLSAGAIKYGQQKGQKAPGFSEAVKQVQQLEKLAEEISPQEISEHVTRAHLFPVVGPKATASSARGGK